MKLSGGGRNGQEGQADETLRWVGAGMGHESRLMESIIHV